MKSRSDTILILPALILAFLVWLQSAAPQEDNSARVFTVKLQVQGLPPKLVVVAPETVDVTVNGPKADLNRLASEAVSASVDLSRLNQATTVTPPISVRVPPGFTARVVKHIPVEVDTVVTLEAMSVRVVPEGTLKEGVQFDPSKSLLFPSKVKVTGPSRFVQAVDRCVAKLNQAQLPVDEPIQVPVEAVDRDGNPVGGATVTPDQVTVDPRSQLASVERDVPVEVMTKGSPVSGYRYVSAVANPATVKVKGLPPGEPLDQIAIPTEEIDLTGLKGEKHFVVKLLPGPGASVEPTTIEVVVHVVARKGGKG